MNVIVMIESIVALGFCFAFIFLAFFPRSELEAAKTYQPASETRKKRAHFPDVTQEFWQFLRDQVKDPESCFINVNFGMRRIGKTSLSACEIETIMSSDPSRELCLFKCPQSLANEFAKIFPGRVYAAEKIVDVRNNCILFVDEALLDLNAKLATTHELRKFGQSLVKTSHKRIILIINAQDDGFMKDLRKKADLVIYKRLAIGFVEEAQDKFIKENEDFLLTLPREKAIVYSNYYNYNETVKIDGKSVFKGLIYINLKKLCPWWNADFSRNLSEISLDQDYEKTKRNIELIKRVSHEMIEKYGKARLLKGKVKKLILGYYLANDLNTYTKIQGMMAQIEEFLVYECENSLETSEDELTDFELPEDFSEDGMSFGQYLQYRLKNRDGKILNMLMDGWTQQKIAQTLKMNKVEVNETIHTYSEQQIGYWLEEWFAFRMGGGKTAGASHAPDFIDAIGRVYTIKYRYRKDSRLTFYKSVDFKPEQTYCEDNLIEEYYFVSYDPQWRESKLKILPVKTFGEDKFIATKSAQNCLNLENV